MSTPAELFDLAWQLADETEAAWAWCVRMVIAQQMINAFPAQAADRVIALTQESAGFLRLHPTMTDLLRRSPADALRLARAAAVGNQQRAELLELVLVFSENTPEDPVVLLRELQDVAGRFPFVAALVPLRSEAVPRAARHDLVAEAYAALGKLTTPREAARPFGKRMCRGSIEFDAMTFLQTAQEKFPEFDGELRNLLPGLIAKLADPAAEYGNRAVAGLLKILEDLDLAETERLRQLYPKLAISVSEQPRHFGTLSRRPGLKFKKPDRPTYDRAVTRLIVLAGSLPPQLAWIARRVANRATRRISASTEPWILDMLIPLLSRLGLMDQARSVAHRCLNAACKMAQQALQQDPGSEHASSSRLEFKAKEFGDHFGAVATVLPDYALARAMTLGPLRPVVIGAIARGLAGTRADPALS